MIFYHSEICRLILGFLEDQNLTETSRVFLNECPHLDECRLYAQRGIQFPKTIHGKTLVGYLNQACRIDVVSIGSQTDDLNANLLNSTTVEPHVQIDTNFGLNDTLRTEGYLEVRASTSESIIDSVKSANKRKSTIVKRKSILSTPPQQQAKIDLTLAASTPCVEFTEDCLSDIESFIKNLCENDFPERLAQSINERKLTKKLTECPSNADSRSAIDVEEICAQKTSPVKAVTAQVDAQHECEIMIPPSISDVLRNELPATAQCSMSVDNNHNNDSNNATMMGGDQFFDSKNFVFDPQTFDELNSSKIIIDNEDISQLAEDFSEPAFLALFELYNPSTTKEDKKDQEKDEEDALPDTIQTLENSTSELVIKLDDNESNHTCVDATINLAETLTDDDESIVQVEKSGKVAKPGEPVYSMSENGKSLIIIAKSSVDLDRMEKQLMPAIDNDQVDQPIEPSPVNQEPEPVQAAPVDTPIPNEQPETTVNLSLVDDEKTKSPLDASKVKSTPKRRPRVRDFYEINDENEHKNEETTIQVVKPAPKPAEVSNKKSRKRNRKYFEDFSKKIMDEIDRENADLLDPDDEMDTASNQTAETGRPCKTSNVEQGESYFSSFFPNIFRYARNAQDAFRKGLKTSNNS